MEQIVVAGRRAIGVGGLAVLPAVLVKAQINKIFIGKYGEQQVICHKKASFKGYLKIIIYPNAR